MTECIACQRIDSIRNGTNRWFVKELAESFVVLCDEQRYKGYCLCLSKTHCEHLHELDHSVQQSLFGGVSLVAEAVQRVCRPLRLNYECLGNGMPHVHWHVIPRFSWDPEPQSPIWVRPKQERKVELPESELQSLRSCLREALS